MAKFTSQPTETTNIACFCLKENQQTLIKFSRHFPDMQKLATVLVLKQAERITDELIQ